MAWIDIVEKSIGTRMFRMAGFFMSSASPEAGPVFALSTHPLVQQLRSELRCDHSYCEVLACRPPTILRGISSSVPQNGVVPALKRALDSQPDIQFASVFGPMRRSSQLPLAIAMFRNIESMFHKFKLVIARLTVAFPTLWLSWA
jgi:hypothetical protein